MFCFVEFVFYLINYESSTHFLKIDSQMTRFEDLSNEIIIECFRYFHGVDLLLSFDQLNYRFNQLVRAIQRLFIDFDDANLSKFNRFCQKLSSNPELKDQIYSLKLSNRSMSIYLFLSRFSLDSLANLQSLTLIQPQDLDISKLKANKLFCSRLSSLHFICSEDRYMNIKLISFLGSDDDIFMDNKHIFNLSSIQKLTVNKCSCGELQQILQEAPNLKCIEIQEFYVFSRYHWHTETTENLNDQYQHINLVQLKILSCPCYLTPNSFKIVFKQMPNLRNLSICLNNCATTDNPNDWQQVITEFLPNLKVFHFHFAYLKHLFNENVYKQYQADFWTREHQWYTDCLVRGNHISISTVPYLKERYILPSILHRCSDGNIKRFVRVKHLEIKSNENNQDYFPHVESIIFNEQSVDRIETIVNELPLMINMRNLKSLIFPSQFRLINPSVLLAILKQAPNISSFGSSYDFLMRILDKDKDLCEHLHKMIKSLEVYMFPRLLLANVYRMNLFWEVFSDVEQLTCEIDKADAVRFLFAHLTKLIRLKVLADITLPDLNTAIIEYANICRLNIHITNSTLYDYAESLIWIIRNTN